jgi:hypothetical protein
MEAAGNDWQTPANGLRIHQALPRPVRQIQIFGQRCSGTNVLTKLLAANFGWETITDRYGFKHWFVPDQILFPSDVLVCVVARHPVDWIRSLHRQPWHAHADLKAMPFSDFIRAEWHSYWDHEVGGIDEHHPMYNREMLHERDPATGRRFANPLRKRTAKLHAWSGLYARSANLCLLDLALLTSAPDTILSVFGNFLQRVPAGDLGALQSYKGNGFNRFVERQYEPLSPADEAFVRSQLDPDVERQFGYALD